MFRGRRLGSVPVNQPVLGDFTCWKEHDAYRQALEGLLRDLRIEAAS
jgi:hypothetical protein